MGDVDQVGLRSGPLVLSEVWQPDEDRVVHRTASVRHDRRAPQTLRLVVGVGTKSITDARRPGNVASELRSPPVFCGLTGHNFTQSLQTPTWERHSTRTHIRPMIWGSTS